MEHFIQTYHEHGRESNNMYQYDGCSFVFVFSDKSGMNDLLDLTRLKPEDMNKTVLAAD